MARIETIRGSMTSRLEHNLREKRNYTNEDIDHTRSHLNYSLTPESHGRSAKDCDQYLGSLTGGAYRRKGGTSFAVECVVQAPADLPKDKEKEFFESTYGFLNDYMFQGDETRVILAQVHHDESTPHLHYIATFPEIENDKYVSRQKRLKEGLEKVKEKYAFSQDIEERLDEIIEEYECKPKEAYAEIRGTVPGVETRDEARWIFNRITRSEKESWEKKLMSKDAFISKSFLERLHPAYQTWINEHGPQCTVYSSAEGPRIHIPVSMLKEYTQRTGNRFSQNELRELTLDRLRDLIDREHEREMSRFERRHEEDNRWRR